jgi:ABC-type lipoprotein export system ATPase subunit
MLIERVQVEEGFLDGLDLHLVPGLNVIIGERGTGKTSLIELVRFCLDVPGYTPESGARSLQHAISVLGSGQVIVTARHEDQLFTVRRQSSDPSPKMVRSFPPPVIFSQSEIESVGLQPNGRLSLVDEFIPQFSDLSSEKISVSEVRSLMAECDSLSREIEQLEKQVAELPIIDQQLQDLASSEQKLAQISSEAATKKKRADALSREISSLSVAGAAVERFLEGATRWRSEVANASRSSPRAEDWPTSAGEDSLRAARGRIKDAQSHLTSAVADIAAATKEAKAIAEDLAARRAPVEEQARKLRKEVEALQSGAGATVRQASQLRERKAQLESLHGVINERRKALVSTLRKRNQAIDELELSREKTSKRREQAAAKLNSRLGPRIRVSVSRAGQPAKFSAVIADILRGSGLRYNELAPAIAKSMSPRELLEAVEGNDYEAIADAAGISKDRAARTVAQIREGGMAELATVPVEDEISLHLLDGQDYKEIGDLSTGQRCTVVLPLVLSHSERVLIVDQPEDHIDNAFIADTVIQAINSRGRQSQTIFSTHNANIPVLGDADKVIQLGSDGHRGFVLVEAPLEEPTIVNAISTVMEGGAEAFKRRALFYTKYTRS